jgi:hypothetical protein
MAEDPKSTEKLSALGKQTMEQAVGAVDTYFEFLKKTVASSPSGGSEFGEKVKSYAEKNITATHEFIKQMSQAKDFQDMMRIQTEFMQTQFNQFSEQAKNLSEAYAKSASEAVTRPLKTS